MSLQSRACRPVGVGGSLAAVLLAAATSGAFLTGGGGGGRSGEGSGSSTLTLRQARASQCYGPCHVLLATLTDVQHWDSAATNSQLRWGSSGGLIPTMHKDCTPRHAASTVVIDVSGWCVPEQTSSKALLQILLQPGFIDMSSSSGTHLRPPCAASWALAAWAAARSRSAWRSFSFSLASLPLPCTAAGATGSCACGSDTPACQARPTQSSRRVGLNQFTLPSFTIMASYSCACQQHAGAACARKSVSIPWMGKPWSSALVLLCTCATAPSAV